MAAIDDLTELVERAAAAEKSALASKWKDEPDVQSLIRRSRKAAEEQRQAARLDTDPHRLSPAGRVCSRTISTSERNLRCPARSSRRRSAPTTGTRTGRETAPLGG